MDVSHAGCEAYKRRLSYSVMEISLAGTTLHKQVLEHKASIIASNYLLV